MTILANVHIGAVGLAGRVRNSEINLGPALDWTKVALCSQIDPEIWFPEAGFSNKVAKGICGKCEVRAECLSYALTEHQRFGVWGGLSEVERGRLNTLRLASPALSMSARPGAELQS